MSNGYPSIIPGQSTGGGLLIEESDGSPSLRPRKLLVGTNLTLTESASGEATLAATAGALTVEEEDANPSVTTTTLKFPNGTLTDNGGGSVSYTPSAADNASDTATAYNDTGGSLAKGTVVSFSLGVTGGVPEIAALADGAWDTQPVGVVQAAIANGASGTVLLRGVLSSFDTSAWAAGDKLYPGASGVLTTSADTYAQHIAIVLTVHATTGTIYVAPNFDYLAPHDHSGNTTGGNLNAATTTGTLAVSERLALTGDITPAQLTGDQNDYNPTGAATAGVFRLDADASRTITGLAGGSDGRVVVLCNIGANNIILADESASSSAGNRFALDAALTLGADTAATLIYDNTASRWRLIGLGKASGGGGMTSFTLAGDGGSSQTIGDGNTLTVAGGTGLASTAGATDTVTVNLDVDSLSEDTAPDVNADFVPTYDASATAHKKVKLSKVGGVTVLADSELGSAQASFDLTSISGSFKHLQLILRARGDNASATSLIQVRLNNDSGSNYQWEIHYGNNTTAAAARSVGNTVFNMHNMPCASATASYFGAADILFVDYTDTTAYKQAFYRWGYLSATTTAEVGAAYCHYLSTSAISRITISLAAGNLDTGSRVTLLGIV
jgi:hypothetical protein